MSACIGQLGRMVQLPYVTSQSVEAEDRFTFQTTLEGRSKAQVRPIGRRSWSLSVSRYLAQDQGTLMSFANGEWGPGPFVFVSADAPVTNMLSPDAASCDPTLALYTEIPGGPLLTADGWAGRSYVNTNPNIELWFGSAFTPVLPGAPVTASAYLLGAGAKVKLYFYDGAGVGISSHVSTVASTAGAVTRSWISMTAPAGAASCRLLAVSAAAGTRPAITWTNALFPWADGQGCPKAVIHGASRDVQAAHRDPRGLRASNISFTVTEVG